MLISGCLLLDKVLEIDKVLGDLHGLINLDGVFHALLDLLLPFLLLHELLNLVRALLLAFLDDVFVQNHLCGWRQESQIWIWSCLVQHASLDVAAGLKLLSNLVCQLFDFVDKAPGYLRLVCGSLGNLLDWIGCDSWCHSLGLILMTVMPRPLS